MNSVFKHLIVSILAVLLCSSVLFSQEEITILIVFDASKRMEREIDGRSKLHHAIQFVEDLVNADIHVNFGLTIFGGDEAGGAEAYSSPVPPARGTGSKIVEELNRLKPAGMSPIASALDHSAESLSPEEVNFIILITDGVENTGGGPVIITEALMRRGILSRLDVVGFIDALEDNPLIAELVKAGNGSYTPAWRSESLIQDFLSFAGSQDSDSLVRTGMIGYRSFIDSTLTFPAYGSTILLQNSDGQIIDSLNFWRGIFENIPAGIYNLIITHDKAAQPPFEIEVVAGQRKEQDFVFPVPTGALLFEHYIRGTADGKAYGTITRVYHSSGETVFTGTSWSDVIPNLPEGVYEVEGYYEGLPPQPKQTVTITSGETDTVKFEFNVGKGRISYKSYLDSLQSNAASGTEIKIFRQPYNELAFDRAQWRATTPFLPIGLYTVEGNYKGIIRTENVEIQADSTSELNFIFNIQQVRFSYQCYENEAKRTPATGVEFQIFNSLGRLIDSSNRWRGNFTLPEGVYKIVAQYKGNTETRTLPLYASDQQQIIIIDFKM